MFVCIFIVIFAPWITPQNPYDLAVISILNSTLPPGEIDLETGKKFLLGTDPQGRDMLSAIIYGMRISLVVAITSTVISVIIGIIAGITAAYVGGQVENLIMRFVDFVLSFPTILVALIILAILGRGVDKVILALVLVQWAYYARTVRGSALVEKNREYIEAAHSQGLPHIAYCISAFVAQLFTALNCGGNHSSRTCYCGGIHPIFFGGRGTDYRTVLRHVNKRRV